jgi:monofunctional biosynthetic peptidoglycan transglycosylase
MARSGNRLLAGAWRAVRPIVLAVVVVALLPYVIAPFYNFVNPASTLMVWRKIVGARVEQRWLPLGQIGPQVPLAVIVAEDGRFCAHHGIDPGELWQALLEADALAEARGGSTITQQTAKNLFLWPSRSLVRKLMEAPLALWLDLVLPKRRILEIYLNIVEWGPDGEFGVEAGAQRAFGRSAAELTRGQAALLVSVLPNPRQRDARRPGPGLRRLGGIYTRRMELMTGRDACVRSR